MKNNSKIIRNEFFQIDIPAGVTVDTIKFPDNANLRNVHLLNIETYAAQDNQKNTPNGASLVDIAMLCNTYLTLYDYTGKMVLNLTPLSNFHTINTQDPRTSVSYEANPRDFVGQFIDWPRSTIKLADRSVYKSAVSFFFVITYAEKTDEAKKALQTDYHTKH